MVIHQRVERTVFASGFTMMVLPWKDLKDRKNRMEQWIQEVLRRNSYEEQIYAL